MRYLLDSNIFIDAIAGLKPAVDILHHVVESQWAGYSSITRLELFGYPGLNQDEETALSTVIGEFVEIEVNAAIIDLAIQIRKSTKIKVPDAIIGATALYARATLITRNDTDFKGINSLSIVNPWQ